MNSAKRMPTRHPCTLTRTLLIRFRVPQPAHDQEACSLLQPLDVGTRWLRFDSWAEQQFRGV